MCAHKFKICLGVLKISLCPLNICVGFFKISSCLLKIYKGSLKIFTDNLKISLLLYKESVYPFKVSTFPDYLNLLRNFKQI